MKIRKQISEEHRKNISKSLEDKPKSKEAKKNMSLAKLGKKLPEETKKNMSENNARYWKGKSFSLSHKNNLAKAKKGNSNALGNKSKKGTFPIYKNSNLKYYIQIIVNKKVRERDKLEDGTWICIACGKKVLKGHASHYFDRERYPRLSFEPNNIHVCCIRCNLFLHGNLIEYRKNLILKIGKESLKDLEIFGFSEESKKPFSQEELIDKKQKILNINERIKSITNQF
jgi:hypothetical protein